MDRQYYSGIFLHKKKIKSGEREMRQVVDHVKPSPTSRNDSLAFPYIYIYIYIFFFFFNPNYSHIYIYINPNYSQNRNW